MRAPRSLIISLALTCICFSSACGYRVAGKANLLPREIRTLAIPAFGNLTTQPGIHEAMARAVAREFATRSALTIVDEKDTPDAVLVGRIVRIDRGAIAIDPVSIDPATGATTGTGRTSAVEINLVFSVILIQKSTGKRIYDQPSLRIKDRYEVSVDSLAYFDEGSPATQRMMRSAARDIVSAVLEMF